jgi:SOS response regulatory protein OraA/RecX
MPTQENTNQKLADYIKKNIPKGYTMDALRFSLLSQGYSKTSVEKSIEIANKQLAAQAPKMQEKPVIKYETIDNSEMAAKMAAQENKGFFGRLFGMFKKKD